METQQKILPLITEQYSSTEARYFIDHCPYALHLHRSGAHENTEDFQVGNAAHFVIQRTGEQRETNPQKIEKIGDTVYRELITNGYEYFGKQHPPFIPDKAIEGRNIAIEYLKEHPLPQNGKFENVLAMDAQGRPCELDGAIWRAKIDVIWEGYEGDGEDTMCDVIVVTDFKSAWNADESELETLQRKSQMVLAWLHYPNKDGVRAEIVNLRTGKLYPKTIMYDNEGIALLTQWRKDILGLCEAMSKTRAVRPGAGCETCPFVEHCEDAQRIAKAEDNAAALAVIEGMRTRLKEKLRHQLKDAAGIECGNGWIGYKPIVKRVVGDMARRQMLANFFEVPLDEVDTKLGVEKGLLQILDPGVTAFERFVKTRFNGEHKAEKKDFMSFLDTDTAVEFGIHKANGNGNIEKLPLLPADTVLSGPPSKSEKTKCVKAAAKAVKTKPTKKRPAKKAKAKKSAKKKVAKRKTAKSKVAVKVRKSKHNKAKTTSKKLRAKKSGRKARK